jgi:hypothetical protein
MQKGIPKRFYFTQISALFPGVMAFVVPLIIFRKYGLIKGSAHSDSVLFIFIYGIICFGLIYPFFKGWAYILIKVGLLNKEESKGYPYSTPWKEQMK